MPLRRSILEVWPITYGHMMLRLLTGAAELKIDEGATLPGSVRSALESIARASRKALMFPNITLVYKDADEVGLALNPGINRIEKEGYTLFAELSIPLAPSTPSSRPEVRLFVERSVPSTSKPISLAAEPSYPRIEDPEHFIWWDSLKRSSVDALQAALESDAGERELHRILELHPILLVQGMNSGHGRWVYSRQHLSLQHEIDFLVAEQDSMGFTWTAIELESLEDPFSQKSEPKARLRHAMDQIVSWRIWLDQNSSHAQGPKTENGLGLRQITSRCQGIVYMGRRHHYSEGVNAWRRHQKYENHIAVRSFDGLLDDAVRRMGVVI